MLKSTRNTNNEDGTTKTCYLTINIGGRKLMLSPSIFIHLTCLEPLIKEFKALHAEHYPFDYDPFNARDKLMERNVHGAAEQHGFPIATSLDTNGFLYVDGDPHDFEFAYEFLLKGFVHLRDEDLTFSEFRLVLLQYGIYLPIDRCLACSVIYNPLTSNTMTCRYHTGNVVFKKNLSYFSCCRQAVEGTLGARGCMIGKHRSHREVDHNDGQIWSHEIISILYDMLQDPASRDNYLKQDDDTDDQLAIGAPTKSSLMDSLKGSSNNT